MDIDALKERLAKMKALADCGTGGERTAADRLIHKICAKYGISIDDIDTEIEREHTVEITQAWKRQIFLQLLGLMRIEQYGDRNADKLHLFRLKRPGGHRGRGKSRRQIWVTRYVTVCTDAQWLELSAKFDVLCFDYTKQLKAFPLAFLISNDHLAKLGAPVAEIVDSYAVIPRKLMKLFQRVPDHGASQMTDMEGLCYVGRGIVEHHGLALAKAMGAIAIALGKNGFDHIFTKIVVVQIKV